MNNLKNIREKLNLNKREMADKVGYAYTTYIGYEAGTRDINSEILKDLAIKLQCSADYILGVKEIEDFEKNISIISEGDTIAAHLEGEGLTKDEIDDITQYIEFIKSKKARDVNE